MPDSYHSTRDFEAIYEQYVVRTLAKISPLLGEPVQLSPLEFAALPYRLRAFRSHTPNLGFWLIMDLKHIQIAASEGMEEAFGQPVDSLKSFLRLIHPDYLLPYAKWALASYELALKMRDLLLPLRLSHRVSVPLRNRKGQYYWYSQHSTVTQVDDQGQIVSHLNTYYLEGKWSERNLRPFEACLALDDEPATDHESALFAQIAPYIIDEFTNAELELLSLYAHGQSVQEICLAKNWTKHTLYEYNANVLKKAKRLFQFDFRTAKDFAAYCTEKGFIHQRDLTHNTPK